MTSKLRLGPLPKAEVVRMTIALPDTVRADLDRYAELYAAAYGKAVDAAALVPHMLAAFMDRDREFRRTRHLPRPASDGGALPTSISDASSSATETTSEGSSSR